MRSNKIVRIKSIIQLAREHGLSVRVSPPSDEKLKDYAGRMGLFQGINYKYPYNKHPPDTFFPIYEITHDRTEFLYDKCRRVLSHSDLPSNYIDNITDAFIELANNIYFHSGPNENTGKGFIHAQAYLQYKKINIAIDDCGVGFLGSYKRTGQVRGRTELQILEDAFKEMESSLNPIPGQGHRGLGLLSVKNFVKDYNCKLEVRTGNSFLSMDSGAIDKKSLTYPYNGTNISLEVLIV